MDNRAFKTLRNYLEKIPAINGPIGAGADQEGIWWVKLQIDINHDLAWHTRANS